MRHILTIAVLIFCAAAGAASDLPAADVTILGEIHDNPDHHVRQAAWVTQIAPRAIVFEMLTPTQAAKVTPETRQSATALEETLGWNAAGWPDFSFYYPIFAASDAQAYGAAVPREPLRAVFKQGPAAVFGDDVATYGLLDALPDSQQQQRETAQMAAHCNALPEHLLPGMVMAQRVRDAALARAAHQAFQDTGGPVVVITGNGHARKDWGLPVPLARVAPDLQILSIGQLEAPEENAPYDLIFISPPAPRDDPCATFKS